MQSLNLGVAAHCLPQPIRMAIRAAVEIEAKALQFDVRNELRPDDLSDSGRRQLLHELEVSGLKISALQFPTRRSLYDLDQLDARVAALKRAMDFAYQLHVPVVTARVGAIPADAESAESKRLVEVLNDLARHGNQIGSTLAITPTRDSAADLKSLFGRITDGLIGLNFDAAVFAMNGRDAVAAFRELHEHVLHVVARDGVRDIDGSGQETTLGRGDVDWPELIVLLSEADYRRWITVDRTHSDDPLQETRQALTYLRRVAFGE